MIDEIGLEVAEVCGPRGGVDDDLEHSVAHARGRLWCAIASPTTSFHESMRLASERGSASPSSLPTSAAASPIDTGSPSSPGITGRDNRRRESRPDPRQIHAGCSDAAGSRRRHVRRSRWIVPSSTCKWRSGCTAAGSALRCSRGSGPRAARGRARRRAAGQLGEDVVEQQHRCGVERLGRDPVAGETEGEREAPLLALGGVGPGVEAVEGQAPLVAMGPGERDPRSISRDRSSVSAEWRRASASAGSRSPAAPGPAHSASYRPSIGARRPARRP